jgi:hypothetical protein
MTAAAIALSVVGYALLAARRRRWRGGTLMAAWWWSVASWTAIVCAQTWWALAGHPATGRMAAVRFIAAVGACCPLMAVLGAKRPQDKPWQFIVLSLWLVLSLPAAQTLLVRPDRAPSPHLALCLFVAAIAAAGIWNGLGTRYFFSALAFSAGQLLLLAAHASAARAEKPAVDLAGMACFVAGWGAAVWCDRAERREVSPLDGAWLEFRDAYGGFWAARVLDRMNAAGRTQNWEVELSWDGFRAVERRTSELEANRDPSARTVSPQLVQTMVNLLRRFMSPEWIAARLGPDVQ